MIDDFADVRPPHERDPDGRLRFALRLGDRPALEHRVEQVPDAEARARPI